VLSTKQRERQNADRVATAQKAIQEFRHWLHNAPAESEFPPIRTVTDLLACAEWLVEELLPPTTTSPNGFAKLLESKATATASGAHPTHNEPIPGA
jgi:hypothetical protein